MSFISGERLYLRALTDADVEGPYPGWLNDPEVCAGNSHHVYPYDRGSAAAYISEARRSREALILAISLHDGDRHVGNISLQRIHPTFRSAELAILLGDRSVWGAGIGTEAGRLLIRHGFETMNLHRIYCGTFEDNIGMRKLATILGMTEEGRRREAAFKAGRYVDVIEFGILAGEYRSMSAAPE